MRGIVVSRQGKSNLTGVLPLLLSGVFCFCFLGHGTASKVDEQVQFFTKSSSATLLKKKGSPTEPKHLLTKTDIKKNLGCLNACM